MPVRAPSHSDHHDSPADTNQDGGITNPPGGAKALGSREAFLLDTHEGYGGFQQPCTYLKLRSVDAGAATMIAKSK